MSAPNRKRVFILGAGFSKPAGMPLSAGLTTVLLHQAQSKAEFRSYIEDLQERLGRFLEKQRAGIEEIFDFAEFDCELWRMRHHGCSVGRMDGETPFARADSIRRGLRGLGEHLWPALLDLEERASRNLLPGFFQNVTDQDAFITFNYDTLVESALSKRSLRWHYGFDEIESGIPVLKVHGSIDWVRVPRGHTVRNGLKLFEKTNVNRGQGVDEHPEDAYVLWRIPDILSRRDEVLPFSSPKRPAMGGLGRVKPLHEIPGIGFVWSRAFEVIKSAEAIYVIGWSASPYDVMARFHFASVLALRQIPLSRVVVVDPKVCEQITNYRAIFGEVKAIGECAECVDWDSLLGKS